MAVSRSLPLRPMSMGAPIASCRAGAGEKGGRVHGIQEDGLKTESISDPSKTRNCKACILNETSLCWGEGGTLRVPFVNEKSI